MFEELSEKNLIIQIRAYFFDFLKIFLDPKINKKKYL